MKKVLSLVLVIAMVLSSMSFAFAGTSFEDVAGNDYEDAINTLVALGVVTGYEDGTYRPEKTVTRAEMAKLMVELLGYGDLVAGSKSNFADTQGHWADAYIALAAGKGLVIGTGDGKFTPDRTVSYDEAITMIVRALGYTDTCNELKNMSWPTNFKVKAAELKLTKDVAMNTTGADRGGVAQLMYNALEATLVTVNSDGDVVKAYTTDDDNDVVYTKLLSRLATLEKFTVDEDALDEDSKDYRGNLVDLDQYMYQNIDAYVNDDDEVVYVDDVNSVVVTGTVTDILKGSSELSYDDDDFTTISDSDLIKVVIKDANEKEYKVKVTDNVVAYYNGAEESLDLVNIADLLFNKAAATVTAIVDDSDAETHTGNDNGKVDNGELALNLVVTKATSGLVVKSDYVEGKTKITAKNGISLVLPQDDGAVDLANVTVTGAVESLNDIEEDDVVIVYAALNSAAKDSYPVELVVARETVEGTVTKTNSDSSTVSIDGTSYKKSSVNGAIGTYSMVVNDEGTFYLDNAGKIFAADTDTELVDYAVVIGVKDGDTENDFNVLDVDHQAQIKLATQDGETSIYKVLTTIDNGDFDDVAKLTKEDGTKINLVSFANSKADIQVSSLLDKDAVAEGFQSGLLVKYSLDSDGNIEALEIVNTENEDIDTDDLDVMAVDSTVVFSVNDDYDVVALDNLNDGLHEVAYFTSGSNKGKVAVILASDVDSVNDGVYGVITGRSYVQNGDGDRVVEVSALVNGEKVTYLSGKNKSTSDFAVTTTSAIYRFEFNTSDVLTSVVFADADLYEADENLVAITANTLSDIDEDGMLINNGQKYFASDVAVYIYDQSAETMRLGDVFDLLDGDDSNEVSTTAYVIDSTDSSRIGIVVQVVK